MRNAIDLYLDLPVENEDELKALAEMASESADRSIAYIGEALKSMRKPRWAGLVTPLIH